MKGRKFGQREVSMDEIQQIIKFTQEGMFRPEIARTLKRSTQTIYRYQKMYDLA